MSSCLLLFRQYLYGAALDKPKPAAAAMGGKAGQKNTGLQSASKAKLVRVETSARRLNELLARFDCFKQDVMQVLLKAEYQRSQAAQREKMLANLDESLKTGAKVGPINLCVLRHFPAWFFRILCRGHYYMMNL